MSLIGRYFQRCLVFLRIQRDEELHWQRERHDDVASLRQAKALSEQALAAELKKRAQQLEHELAVNAARYDNELAMVKIQCQQALQDYQQYLQSLDKLKLSLRDSYAHLPEAVAFTIHHHAKQLLNRMWEAEDDNEKRRLEMHLLRFMSAVHEDSQMALMQPEQNALPSRTLSFLEGGHSG